MKRLILCLLMIMGLSVVVNSEDLPTEQVYKAKEIGVMNIVIDEGEYFYIVKANRNINLPSGCTAYIQVSCPTGFIAKSNFIGGTVSIYKK